MSAGVSALELGLQSCEGCGLLSRPAPGAHEGRCPRCDEPLEFRKRQSLQRTWAFVLEPLAEGRATRLITRVRGSFRLRDMLRATPPVAWPMWLVIEPGAFVMERKMLIEIKRRAERTARDSQPVVSDVQVESW